MRRCGKCAGCRRLIETGDRSAQCALLQRGRLRENVKPYDPDGDYDRMIERLRLLVRRHGTRRIHA